MWRVLSLRWSKRIFYAIRCWKKPEIWKRLKCSDLAIIDRKFYRGRRSKIVNTECYNNPSLREIVGGKNAITPSAKIFWFLQKAITPITFKKVARMTVMKSITTIFHAISSFWRKEKQLFIFLSVQKRAFTKDTADFTPIDVTLRVVIASRLKI